LREDLLTADITMIKWLAHGRLLVAADAVGKVVLLAFDPFSVSFTLVQKV